MGKYKKLACGNGNKEKRLDGGESEDEMPTDPSGAENRFLADPTNRNGTISSWDATTRQFSCIVVTGAQKYRFADCGGMGLEYYDEQLVVTDEAFDRSRFENYAPFVYDHSDEVAKTIGHIIPGSLQIDNANQILSCRIQATLDENLSDEGRQILGKIIDGTLRHMSVKYKKLAFTVQDRDGEIPLYLITRWEAIHLSSVSAGYNDEAVSLSEASPEAQTTNTQGEKIMGVEVEKKEGAPATPIVADHELSAAQKKVAYLERELSIRERGRMLGIDEGKIAEIVATKELSERDATDKLISLRAANETPRIGKSATAGMDSDDKRRIAVEAVIESKLGFPTDLTGNPYAMFSIAQLAHDGLTRAGVMAGNTPGELFDNMKRAHFTRSLSQPSADFPAILQNVLNKRMLKAYSEQTPSYRQWSTQSNPTDYKEASLVRLSGIGELKEIGEGGSGDFQKLLDSKETWRVKPYNTKVALTKMALVNDDLSAFAMLPRGFVAACARTEQTLALDPILSNTAMGDTKALFHADHGNIASAAAISATSLGNARKFMKLQTGLNGELLSIRPKYLLCSTAAYDTVQQLLSPNYVPSAKETAVVDWMRALIVIEDPRIDKSATPNYWYLIADPTDIDVAMYGYLSSAPGPQIRTQTDFSTEDMQMICGLDFGYKVADWRAFVQVPYAG